MSSLAPCSYVYTYYFFPEGYYIEDVVFPVVGGYETWPSCVSRLLSFSHNDVGVVDAEQALGQR